MSKKCCTFAPANSRWGVCTMLWRGGGRHIIKRLLTLVFDFLKRRKFQRWCSKTRRVDARGRILRSRVPYNRVHAWLFLYAAWVSALLIRHYGFFLRPQEADKQKKRSAFFDVRNHLLWV